MKIMRRVWLLSHAATAQSECLLWKRNGSRCRAIISECFSNDSGSASSSSTTSTPSPSKRINVLLSDCFLDSDSWRNGRLNLNSPSENLLEELLCAGDNVLQILEEKVRPTMSRGTKGSAFIELMEGLVQSPPVVIEVLNWRRKQGNLGFPMAKEEYSKSIAIAGRLKKVDLAIELFKEACEKKLKTTSTCNALLGVLMYNCYPDKCFELFRDMKNNSQCAPTIVTMNMILSVFGRTMLITQMELVMQEIVSSKLSPNLSTFNIVIEGYITSWMWESMERAYNILLRSPFKPNPRTYELMLRGYALSGNITQMEEIYDSIKHRSNFNWRQLIKCMICAYLKSSAPDRVAKVEALLGLIPKKDYTPWLNVLMIKFYAKEDMIEKMEASIDEAFERSTVVVTVHVMRAIVAAYFRFHALEKLTDFVKRAELGGWKLCKSLFHCKMIMCGGRGLFNDMENVIREMKNCRLDFSRKTLVILYNAYFASGHSDKVNLLLGFMYKSGYPLPTDPLCVAPLP